MLKFATVVGLGSLGILAVVSCSDDTKSCGNSSECSDGLLCVSVDNAPAQCVKQNDFIAAAAAGTTCTKEGTLTCTIPADRPIEQHTTTGRQLKAGADILACTGGKWTSSGTCGPLLFCAAGLSNDKIQCVHADGSPEVPKAVAQAVCASEGAGAC